MQSSNAELRRLDPRTCKEACGFGGLRGEPEAVSQRLPCARIESLGESIAGAADPSAQWNAIVSDLETLAELIRNGIAPSEGRTHRF